MNDGRRVIALPFCMQKNNDRKVVLHDGKGNDKKTAALLR